jgi:hypothetical protein
MKRKSRVTKRSVHNPAWVRERKIRYLDSVLPASGPERLPVITGVNRNAVAR